jgi:hypothetical protein
MGEPVRGPLLLAGMPSAGKLGQQVCLRLHGQARRAARADRKQVGNVGEQAEGCDPLCLLIVEKVSGSSMEMDRSVLCPPDDHQGEIVAITRGIGELTCGLDDLVHHCFSRQIP